MKNWIDELVEKLNNATKEYDKGTPIMEDSEWDAMYFKLVELEKISGYQHPMSPTKIIYPEIVSSLTKTTHNHPMLSLAKTKDINEVNKYFKGKALAMCKLDGLTCSLRYVNGHLTAAETRGDGKVGEDILHNALVVESIPHHIPFKEEIVVDGEIICTYEDFKAFEKDYKNPRNFAAGSIRLLDSRECKKRNLTFVVWDIIKGFNGVEFLSEKLKKLRKYFSVVPYVEADFGNEKAFSENVIQHIKDLAEQNSYPIDGVVIKYDDIAFGRTLGATEHHFNNALAFKFVDDAYETRLISIDWTMGRTGALTPVAVFEPIEIDGTIVERASLHNVSVMKEIMGDCCYSGQKIEVIKANQIIPQIISAYKMSYADVVKAGGVTVDGFSGELLCPICEGGTAIETSDSGTQNLVCQNPACQGKLINNLDHYCSKKGLDIKGLSKATLEKLIDWGWISNIYDLYNLGKHRAEWIKKTGFGVASVDKILNAIEQSKNCTLLDFISALGIPLVGKAVAKELVKYVTNYDDFKNKIQNGYDFTDIDGFGPMIDKALKTFNYEFADKIYCEFMIITNEQEEVGNSLAGMVIVITGKLKNFKNRDALKAEIENRGGKVAGAITAKTSYLINNDVNSQTAKNKSAQKLGVEIISEEDFIAKFLK